MKTLPLPVWLPHFFIVYLVRKLYGTTPPRFSGNSVPCYLVSPLKLLGKFEEERVTPDLAPGSLYSLPYIPIPTPSPFPVPLSTHSSRPAAAPGVSASGTRRALRLIQETLNTSLSRFAP